ncbi:MAG: hypothetical protein ACREN5_06660, partial [Gemmatimonadales bacterium]
MLTADVVTCVVCGGRWERQPSPTDRWTWTDRAWFPMTVQCVEALIAAELGPRAIRMVLAVAARTWGVPPDPLSAALGRRRDWVACSVADLGRWSRQDRSHASKTLAALAARNILWV